VLSISILYKATR